VSSVQARRDAAPFVPHPLRRVTDWPAAGASADTRQGPSRATRRPARRMSDRLLPAPAVRHVAVRRPCAAPRRRRGRAVAAHAAGRRRDDDSDGGPAPSEPLPTASGPSHRTLPVGVFGLFRVPGPAPATGAAHGHVTTFHVGWPQGSGRMRTSRPATTIPGEAVPERAAEPLREDAPVPRATRAPAPPGIAAQAFPERCSPHRSGNAGRVTATTPDRPPVRDVRHGAGTTREHTPPPDSPRGARTPAERAAVPYVRRDIRTLAERPAVPANPRGARTPAGPTAPPDTGPAARTTAKRTAVPSARWCRTGVRPGSRVRRRAGRRPSGPGPPVRSRAGPP
jgi:hypothetical protein